MDWDNPGLWWIAAGALLAGVELLVPGVFLIFVAMAAAITGAFVLLFPDLPLAGQLASLAAWSAVTIGIGRRWYVDYSPDSADPLLNDVGARLLGATVTVVSSNADGSGRVRVADGEWPSRGPMLPAGTSARVVGVQNTTLIIEPISPE